jgi:hypothetical protein
MSKKNPDSGRKFPPTPFLTFYLILFMLVCMKGLFNIGDRVKYTYNHPSGDVSESYMMEGVVVWGNKDSRETIWVVFDGDIYDTALYGYKFTKMSSPKKYIMAHKLIG